MRPYNVTWGARDCGATTMAVTGQICSRTVFFSGPGFASTSARIVAALYAGVQVVSVNLWNVIFNLDPFSEVLAWYVDAPLGGKLLGDPLVDAAAQKRDLAVAYALQGGNGDFGPATVVVAQDDLRAFEWYGIGHLGF